LSDFHKKLIFSKILEKCSCIKFYEIHPVGAELFRADRQTDMTKLRR